MESAARTYFGPEHPAAARPQPVLRRARARRGGHARRDHRLADRLRPAQPPDPGQQRRDSSCATCSSRVHRARPVRRRDRPEPPDQHDIRPPAEDTKYPYFTLLVNQQVVDKLGGGQERAARLEFEGERLRVRRRSTRASRTPRGVRRRLAARPHGPRASVVASSNDTGGGARHGRRRRLRTAPFNLATQGQRQPGAVLQAVHPRPGAEQRISPDSMWASRTCRTACARTAREVPRVLRGAQQLRPAPYAGTQSLRSATTYSDNCVYAQVGDQGGNQERRPAWRTGSASARRSRTTLAMTLGGLSRA